MQAPSEALFLAQIVLLLLVGRLMGEAMQRCCRLRSAYELGNAFGSMIHSTVGRLEIDSEKNLSFHDHSALFQGEQTWRVFPILAPAPCARLAPRVLDAIAEIDAEPQTRPNY
jgi:hypothetical protein